LQAETVEAQRYPAKQEQERWTAERYRERQTEKMEEEDKEVAVGSPRQKKEVVVASPV